MAHLQRHILTALLLTLVACGSSDKHDVLVKVGDIEITVNEFRKRFEFNPRLLQFKNIEEGKYRYLASLIAEKLLASAAPQGQTQRNQAFMDQIHREAVIEEFYNRQTNDHIDVSEAEIRRAYERSRVALQVASARFPTLEAAQHFAQLARSSGSFDVGLATESDGASDSPQIETASVRWASVNLILEDRLYAMEPGEISDPIAIDGEFHVVQVLEQKIDAFANEETYQLAKAKLVQKITQRNRAQAFMAFFKRMMSQKKTNIASDRIHSVVEKLADAFDISAENEARVRVENPGPLSESELTSAMLSLDDLRGEILIVFEAGEIWTVETFLHRLSVGRYHIDFTNKQRFRTSLRQALITMIEHEYVFMEGIKNAIDKTAYVTDEVGMWRENLAAHLTIQGLLTIDSPAAQGASNDLSDTQLRLLTTRLSALLADNQIAFDRDRFDALETVNAGLLMLKTHFPGRLVVPVNIPLENLQEWQDLVLARLADPAN